jgi:DNA-binding NarL/FixJ family response regulator
LIDGHRAVADAPAASIGAHPDIDVVATVRSVAQINEGIDVDFNLALTRYILPDGTGVDVTRALKQRWAHRKVVALSAVTNRSAVARLKRAGADAIVGRDESLSDLVTVLRATHNLTANVVATAPEQRPGSRSRSHTSRHPAAAALTAREMEVLVELCRGNTSSQICAELGIGQNTLRTHVQKIINKLNVNSRLEAVALAQREGIV